MKDLMQKGFSRKQPGVTSLLLVLAIGLTLTVMIAGISALSIREQQQASNTELSSKALQAAESGVKLALQKLNDNPSFSTPADTCKKLGDLGIEANVGSNSEITCIEVKNVFTGSYEGKIERDKATQVFIGGQACPKGQNPDGSCVGGVVIANKGANNFQFRWHSKTLDQTLADYTNIATYPVVEGYKSAASIEMTFIYWPRAKNFTQVKSATVFFVPGQDDLGYSAADGTGRTQVKTDCAANSPKNGNYRCGIGGDLGINLQNTLGLAEAGENYNFAIRIKPYYADTHFEATAFIDSSTNTVPIQSSKAQIDVTAKTNNLYRRVKAEKVIIPSAVENIFESTIYSASTGTLGSNAGICKTIVVLKDNTLAPNQPACN